jgi:8-oxo-dGTP pyrophosphatase MutT (NUDIX family)
VEATRPPGSQELGLKREVRAAGGVVWRPRGDGDIEVLLVHRPRYGDWSFPKGKLEDGETDEEAALREVEEETGLRCELGRELPSTSYTDLKLRPKTVRYWEMRPLGGEAAPRHEVDQVRWLPRDEAEEQLSYDRDVEILRALEPR